MGTETQITSAPDKISLWSMCGSDKRLYRKRSGALTNPLGTPEQDGELVGDDGEGTDIDGGDGC